MRLELLWRKAGEAPFFSEKCNLRYRFSPIEKIMRNFMQKEGDLYNLANYKSITNA